MAVLIIGCAAAASIINAIIGKGPSLADAIIGLAMLAVFLTLYTIFARRGAS